MSAARWEETRLDVVEVRDEPLTIAAVPPARWHAGTPLAQVRNIAPGVGVPVPGALARGSLRLCHEGRLLVEGVDYLLDETWGTVGAGDGTWPLAGVDVLASYVVVLSRLDAIVVDAQGSRQRRAGVPHLSCPRRPELDAADGLVATVLACQFAPGLVFPVGDDDPPPGATTVNALADLWRRADAGERLRIVCWGDSVTEGAEATRLELAYSRLLEDELRRRHPGAEVAVEAVAVGGAISAQWVEPERWPAHPRAAECNLDRVLDLHPDVVTVEFVNDCMLDAEAFARVYGRIAERLCAAGCAVVAITPHRTFLELTGPEDLLAADPRPYVGMLRRWAVSHGFAIADVSARWDGLAAVGVPYTTLLANGINHPDDRGHRLFVEELLRCFG